MKNSPPSTALILDHVRLDVLDIDRAQKFYEEALALAPIVRYDLEDRVILQMGPRGSPPGVELWMQRNAQVVPHSTHHVDFYSSDVLGTVERIRSMGYAIDQGPFMVGSETVVILRDPDGHRIEINDFVGRGNEIHGNDRVSQ